MAPVWRNKRGSPNWKRRHCRNSSASFHGARLSDRNIHTLSGLARVPCARQIVARWWRETPFHRAFTSAPRGNDVEGCTHEKRKEVSEKATSSFRMNNRQL